jgi:hypothetical protein
MPSVKFSLIVSSTLFIFLPPVISCITIIYNSSVLCFLFRINKSEGEENATNTKGIIV